MTIRRGGRLETYTKISNGVAQNPSISLEAKGLWLYLISQPLDWRVLPKALMKTLGIGKDKMYRILNELIDAKLMQRNQTRQRTADGREVQGYMEYIVFDEPYDSVGYNSQYLENQNAEKVNQCPKNQNAGKADALQTTYSNKHISLTGDTYRKNPPPKRKSSSKKEFEPKVERAENVSTTNREHNRLVEEHGEEVVRLAYDELSAWKCDPANKNKWKAGSDDNRRMRKWAIDEVLKEISKRRQLELDRRRQEIQEQELKQREERIGRINKEKGSITGGKSNSNPCLSEEARRQYDDAF